MPDDDAARAQESKKVEKARKFVVDGIFPRGLVHLIAAPVGTGKTTLLMQLVHAIQAGDQFLSRSTYPVNVTYICADRGKRETMRTVERLGLKVEMRIESLKDMRGTIPYLETFLSACKQDEMAIVEPINYFIRNDVNRTGNINNYGDVSNFLLKIGRIAEDKNLTILGSLHSSKAKVGEGYMVPREKVMGSAAWTAFSGTAIVMEPVDPKTPEDPGRTLYVLPRDERPFTLDYVVDSDAGGLLIPSAAFARRFKSQLDKCLESHPEPLFTNQHLLEWQTLANVSQATTYRWLEQKIKNGEVERVEKGVCKKRFPV